MSRASSGRGQMIFRKKPVEIEARQFETNNEPGDNNMNSLVTWVHSEGGEARHDGTDVYIKTLEGEMKASVGDWIIQGVKGEFYPCKADIFEMTYEPVKEKTIHNPITGMDYPIAQRKWGRSRRLDGAWRKKRSDAGKKRKNASPKQ